MTDRELLELAAKAAGIRLIDWNENWHDDCNDFGPGYRYEESDGFRVCWNPLTDDGDALRLAVKLCLTIEIADYGTGARRGSTGKWKGCEAHIYQGSERATRYAIVLAAAEIGKSLP